MIAGIGLDVVELARVEGILMRRGPRFVDRVLTPAEKEGAHGDLVTYLAGRLAAKEAGVKALATGFADRVGWRDLEVLRLPSGAPRIEYAGAAREKLQEMGVVAAHVSVTHSRVHAAAVVILETD